MKFSISRYNPELDAKPCMQKYEIELLETDHMLLDVILRLKEVPPLTAGSSAQQASEEIP